jgi:hypothetical protein
MDDVVRFFVEQRLTPCRHELTLQLLLRSGAFWEAIKTVRDRWGIVAVTKVPSDSDRIPYPPVCPEPSSPQQPDDADPYDWTRSAHCWQEDIQFSLYRAIPRRCRLPQSRWEVDIWLPFLSACIRFDPPETDLLTFAKQSLPPDEFDVESTWVRDNQTSDTIHIVTPTMTISEVDRSDVWHRRYERLLIDELHRRLEPIGIDFKALVREVQADPNFLAQLLAYPVEPDHSKVQVVVTAEATVDEFREAWDLFQPWLQQSRGRRPKIDKLEAVQAAIWSQQGWTEKEIAEYFGWHPHPDSIDTRKRLNATRYRLKVGRDLLRGRINSAG